MENEAATCAALIAALDHSDKAKIRVSVDALITLASDSAAVKTILEQRLADPRCKNRWALAYILARLPEPSAAVIQTLEDALDHDDAEIRWAITLLLAQLAQSEARITDRVVELCANGTPTQRRMALYCMRELKLNDGRSLESVFKALNDAVPLVRVAAVITLKARSHLDENGKQALLELFLNDPDTRVRNVAAITLAVLGRPSEQFLAALRDATGSDHPQIKKAAFAALSLLHDK